MGKQFTNVTQTVGFVAMDGIIYFLKGIDEFFYPDAVQFTESLGHQTIVFEISALLGTTLDNHITQLFLKYMLINA
jgi:hypothetical protein